MNISANESIFSSVDLINENTYLVCSDIPPYTASDGLWGSSGRSILRSSLPLFELQMLVIFAITQICHFFLTNLDFPKFISQMIAGLILGPSIELEALDKIKRKLFPFGSQDTLATITSIGFVIFIFITGVQMDLSMITRTGRKAWLIAIIGSAAPLLICLPTFAFLGPQIRHHIGHQTSDIPTVVITHNLISFAVVASLLNELKILNSELGRLALSSVLVSDILGTTIGSIYNVITGENIRHGVIVHLASLIAFFILVPIIFRPAMLWIIKHTPEGRPVHDSYVYIIISMVFALGCVSIQLKQQFILGAFVLGLAVPEGPPLGSALVKKLQFFGTSLFLPIFVTCAMIRVDFSLKYSSESVMVIVLFTVITHLIKIIASIIPALFCKMPFKDALALVLILNTKGVVEVGLFYSIYDEGTITRQTYGMMMISIMIISCIVKWSVKVLYDPSRKYAGYQTRNILSLKSNSELRIVSCVHKPYHISAIRDVLDLCCPTTEHPIIVDALHLVELVGRTSPIFISHRHQKIKSGSHKSYSDDVIVAFDIYKHDNLGAVTAHTYTAISPPNLMYEDVCQLVLDKVASMIILPFHQRWSSDGAIESDDKNIRSLNRKVLEVAPCSVGILVTRSSFQCDSPIRLAMIYLGGNDDREALCLAKRAMRNPRINLVVYHLDLEEYIPSFEYLLDKEALEDIKKPHSSLQNVRYQRVIVNDGPETSVFLRDIVNEHDFFIVGRSHGEESPQTEGLTEWSEFSELGAIGDLLASPDFRSRACVLVVQQQAK